jgi:hypothetical protein
LTETTGFISPQSWGVTTNPEEAEDPDDVADVDEDEQAAATRPLARRPAAASVKLVRRAAMLDSRRP